jgi:hypothetical protein
MPEVIPSSPTLDPGSPPNLAGAGSLLPGDPAEVQPAPGVPTPGTVTPVTPETPAMYPGAAPGVHPSTPGLFPGTPPSTTPEAPPPPENPEAFALKIQKIETDGLATGGGDLSGDRVITVKAASQTEAVAGTATNVAMTPLRTAQYVAAWWANVTTAVKTTGNQVISGLKTYATSPRSTGNADADTSLMTRKQVDLRRFPFLRPTEAGQWRQVLENFAGGTLTSPTIGNWNWSANLDGGSITEAVNTLVSGRGLNLATAAVAGSRLSLYRAIGASGAEDLSAVTFQLRNYFLDSPSSLLTGGAVWMGWRDSDLDSGSEGRFEVGWDWAESPNILIRQQGSAGASPLVVIDTEVPIPNDISWAQPTLSITLIGRYVAGYFGGTADKRRVIIAGPQPISTQVILDVEVTPSAIVYNNRLFVDVMTNAAETRAVILQGIELYHEGPHYGRIG